MKNDYIIPKQITSLIINRHYSPGEIIIHEGDSCDAAFVLRSGRCKIYTTSSSGQVVIQNIITSTDIFGIIEQYEALPYICTVEALSEVDVQVIPRVTFLDWLKIDHLFARRVLEIVSAIAYRQIEQHSTNIMYPLKFRFISYLLDEYYRNTSTLIRDDKKMMAQKLATTLRHLNRTIKWCVECGAISYQNGVIKIIDIERLKGAKDL